MLSAVCLFLVMRSIRHITAKGLVIHNANCSNVRDANKDPEKFIKVEWDTVVTANLDFQTGLRIELENRQGILSESQML